MPEQETVKKLGRYEVVRELGRGAMGVVYEGRDPVVGRRVAIKTARHDVLEKSARAEELMARFLREARAAGALNHPNIVTIYDAGEENGVAYIAMEYLDGTDLQKLIESQKRFDTERVLEITSTVCAALDHAHANGVIHRDIKPANIVVLPNGTIKVADFGIARVSDSQLTQEGSMIGTPHYMSPEQFMGHPVDGRSDIFSVGIIVYEMLTGEKPFHGRSVSAVMHNVLNTMPVPPRELNFAVSDCLSKVVMKALSKDPRDRYQRAEAMSQALRECQKEHPNPEVLMVDPPAMGSLGDTVAKAGPEPGATVVMAKRSDGALADTVATPAGAPGATAAAERTSVTGPDEELAGAGRKRPRARWPYAAVAAIAVLGAGTYLAVAGGKATPEVFTANIPAQIELAKQGEPSYAGTQIRVGWSDNLEVIENSDISRATPLSNPSIEVLARGKSVGGSPGEFTPVLSKTRLGGSEAIVNFSQPLLEYKVIATMDGYDSGEATQATPKSEKQSGEANLVLSKSSSAARTTQ